MWENLWLFSRKNPVHFQEYSHDQEESDDEENSADDLPECPYGEYCYRQNPRHRREYKHTPRKLVAYRKKKCLRNKNYASLRV